MKKTHGIRLPPIKMSLSKLDTWEKNLNQGIRDPNLQQGIWWNPQSYSGLHVEVQLKTIMRALPPNPQVVSHTVLTSQTEGLTSNPQTTRTQLEGLTNHPQITYPTRGPYHPPSFFSNFSKLTEGLTTTLTNIIYKRALPTTLSKKKLLLSLS